MQLIKPSCDRFPQIDLHLVACNRRFADHFGNVTWSVVPTLALYLQSQCPEVAIYCHRAALLSTGNRATRAMTCTSDITPAADRLKVFRYPRDGGVMNDDQSHLTMADLPSFIAAVADDAVIEGLMTSHDI